MRDPHDPWQDELTASVPVPQLTPTETELRRKAITDCPRCDPDGYTGTTVCNHAPEDPAQTAQRHIARIRAEMGWESTSPHAPPQSAPECATAPATHAQSHLQPPQKHPHTAPTHQPPTSTPHP